MNWKQQLVNYFGYKSLDDMPTRERSIAEWIENNVVGKVRASDDDVQFLQHVRRERNAFVNFVNNSELDRQARTACETILIVYDQMRERL